MFANRRSDLMYDQYITTKYNDKYDTHMIWLTKLPWNDHMFNLQLSFTKLCRLRQAGDEGMRKEDEYEGEAERKNEKAKHSQDTRFLYCLIA